MNGNNRNNGNNRSVTTPVPPAQLSEATVQRMLAVQEQKISLELKQADLALRELDHNQKIADKSIDAQAADRKDERQVSKDMHRASLRFASIVTISVISFILVALWMGKDAIVLDIIKVLLGFAGGWGASKAVDARKKNDANDED